MLYTNNLSKEFGTESLFSGVDLIIGGDERVGLVGANGAGKTTLLRMFAGHEQPSEGAAGFRDGTLGLLRQQGALDTSRTLLEEMWEAFPTESEAKRRLSELERELQESDVAPDLVYEHTQLLERFKTIGGYTIEARIDRVLRGLGFSAVEKEKLCGDFSGGWRMRIALATILVHQPDHILLDEPTNHLDKTSQEWLAGELSVYPGTVLMVTHDGSFLDRVVTRIVEIDQAKVFSYVGTYSSHLKQKADRIELQNKAAARQAREIQKQEDYINRFRAAANRASQVQSREKAVAKIERIVKHQDSAKTKFTFVPHGRVEREVLKLTGISHAWEDDLVLLDLDLVVERGQKVALIGPNGGGKSTLLRIAAREVKPSEGTVEWAEHAQPGYYEQHQDEALNPRSTVIEEVRAATLGVPIGIIRNALAHFLFRSDDVFKPISVLSGGERSRVALAKFLIQPTNVLLLDEPTNHLDAATRESLLGALADYDGTIICASHDPGILERIATVTYELNNGDMTPLLLVGNSGTREKKGKKKHNLKGKKKKSTPAVS